MFLFQIPIKTEGNVRKKVYFRVVNILEEEKDLTSGQDLNLCSKMIFQEIIIIDLAQSFTVNHFQMRNNKCPNCT